MLAADLEAMTLRIGCAKQKFPRPMNSWKWELGIASKSWQLFFSLTQIIVMWEKIELYLVEEINNMDLDRKNTN